DGAKDVDAVRADLDAAMLAVTTG
ncbi:MAG: hypothetical protein JWO69_562, partial [Thermoleophilia bacterium]|nr:hypothetical protein [Thermoleophilia bacterium]